MNYERKGKVAAAQLQPIIDQLSACRTLWDRALDELGAKSARAIDAHREYTRVSDVGLAERLRDSAVDLAESSKIARAIEDLEAARTGAADIIARLRALKAWAAGAPSSHRAAGPSRGRPRS